MVSKMKMSSVPGTGMLRFDELLMAFSMSMRGTGTLDNLTKSPGHLKYFLSTSNISRPPEIFLVAEEKLKWAFKLYDVDCSGTIDRNEMILIFEKLCRFSLKIMYYIT